MNKAALTLLLIVFIQSTFAQYQMALVPRESPDRSVSQKVGYTEVVVTYGSPRVKNRLIIGELVPYEKLWRAGANNATTFYVDDEIFINGQKLDSGAYALFIIPRETEKWTLILNKGHKQWGAFKYDGNKDALRVGAYPFKVREHTENLTYTLTQNSLSSGTLRLYWNDFLLEIPFETNYLEKFKKEVIEKAEKQPNYLKWVVYIQGAEHLQEIDANHALALHWINTAESIMKTTTKWNEQFYPRDYVKGHLYLTKGKLLTSSNQTKEAQAYFEKIPTLENKMFYERNKEVINQYLSQK